MATVNFTPPPTLEDSVVFVWTPLTEANNDGQPAQFGGSGDRTFQVVGNFGAGGTVVLEGSLDGANWFGLNNPAGTAISLTAAGLRAVLENVSFIRPRVTAGTGVSVTAILLIRRSPSP